MWLSLAFSRENDNFWRHVSMRDVIFGSREIPFPVNLALFKHILLKHIEKNLHIFLATGVVHAYEH